MDCVSFEDTNAHQKQHYELRNKITTLEWTRGGVQNSGVSCPISSGKGNFGSDYNYFESVYLFESFIVPQWKSQKVTWYQKWQTHCHVKEHLTM